MTKQEIETAIRNYRWLTKEVARLRYELQSVNAKASGTDSKYGRPYNPTLNEVLRRERKKEILLKFEYKINFIETYASVITTDKEITVLNCLLDGMNINAIARHMGYAKRTIYLIKEQIIEKIKHAAESRD